MIFEQFLVAEGVVKGGRDQLFISGGSQRVEQYLLGLKSPTTISLANFGENLRNRREASDRLGARYCHIVCPDKQSVYSDDYPLKDVTSLGSLYQKTCGEQFIYPVDYLKPDNIRETYFRTDSHWNHIGAFEVSMLIMNALEVENLEPIKGARLEKARLKHYIGDLGVKLSPRDGEEVRYFDEIFAKIYLSNDFKKNNGLMRIVVNSSANNEDRLLVFGDSFLNYCISNLSDFFKYTLFIRTPYFHNEIAKLYSPTHIVSGNAERYLSNVRSDSEAENAFLMPFLRGLQFSAENNFYLALNSLTGSSRKSIQSLVFKHVQGLMKDGDLDLALQIAQNLSDGKESSAELSVTLSRIWLAKGEIETALRTAYEAIEKYGRSASALCHLGAVLLRSNNNVEAQSIFSEALQFSNPSWVAYRGMAMCFERQKRYDVALNYAESAAKLSNFSADVVKYNNHLIECLKNNAVT